MKKTLFTILMSTAAFVFADQPIAVPTSASNLTSLSNLPIQEKSDVKKGFVYVRFSAAENDFTQTGSVLPGLGIGYRRLTGQGAGDISISGIGHGEHKNGRVLWTAPKTSYIHYFEPDATKSLYAGGGIAWGGVHSRNVSSIEDKSERREFIGIIPSAMLGYEFARRGSILGFAELTVSQPALSVTHVGAFPGPIAEFSTGIGF